MAPACNTHNTLSNYVHIVRPFWCHQSICTLNEPKQKKKSELMYLDTVQIVSFSFFFFLFVYCV